MALRARDLSDPVALVKMVSKITETVEWAGCLRAEVGDRHCPELILNITSKRERIGGMVVEDAGIGFPVLRCPLVLVQDSSLSLRRDGNLRRLDGDQARPGRREDGLAIGVCDVPGRRPFSSRGVGWSWYTLRIVEDIVNDPPQWWQGEAAVFLFLGFSSPAATIVAKSHCG